jgi:hypothetical protein
VHIGEYQLTLYRNLAGQEVFFMLVDVTSGAPVTGATVAAWLTKDGGAQSAAGGTVDDLGHGQYRYNFSRGDTNGGTIGLLLLATNCVPVSFAWATDAIVTAPPSAPAPATTYNAAALAAIRASRLRGIRTVQFADRSVTYTSDAEMRQVEADILQELAVVGARTRPKQTYGVSTKGF